MSPMPGRRLSRIPGISWPGRRSRRACRDRGARAIRGAGGADAVRPAERPVPFRRVPAVRRWTATAHWIAELDDARATVIVFENPKRVHRLLVELCETLGEDRDAALCRELTKRFEEVRRGRWDSCAICADGSAEGGMRARDRSWQGRTPVRGQRAGRPAEGNGGDSVKAAVREVADRTGLPRREVYQMALRPEGGR
jgi:hypothetical protein